MGNCEAIHDNTKHIFAQHSRTEVKGHLFALAKLDYFDYRVAALRDEAEQDAKKIQGNILSLIQEKRQKVKALFDEQIRKIQEKKEAFQKANIKNQTIEEFVGLPEMEEQFQLYQDKVMKKLNTIKDEMIENNEAAFQSIKQSIQKDIVTFYETDELKVEDLNNFFEKMRVSYQKELKQAQQEVEAQFKKHLNPYLYKKKMQNVAPEKELNLFQKMKPNRFRFIENKNSPLIAKEDLNILGMERKACCFL